MSTDSTESTLSLLTRIEELTGSGDGANSIQSLIAIVKQRLQEAESRYRALTDNVPVGVYRRTPGPEGKLVMVNKALVEMFGYRSPVELNQVPVANLYYYPEECIEFSKKLFSNREVIKEELKMRTRNGDAIWISVTAAVICDEQSEVIYFDGIMEDITARKEQAQAARAQQEQLLQADKMISLGILVSGVAHEINNPNQFVLSHLTLLQKAWKDALPILDRYYEEHGDFKLGGTRYSKTKTRINTMYENMREGTTRITHIVNELRDYARQQPTQRQETVHLNQVVDSALSLLKNLTKKETSAFYVTYGKHLPPFMGDYRRIEQVIINLVQNAVQALESSPREISIITFKETIPGSHSESVVFQINDTGKGISDEDLKKITNPFFTTKRSSGGTGLGLSISANIVSSHGGKLEFASAQGEGTTVKMILPALEEKTA
ncbi:MAG: PAS domain S-box protein [Deltaproteobacteria bacterium]|nr:PAS domain S-box protein [Deltaproteobacteria bacterium]MBN2671850.1 PAS domain S-box protein [Deltaproteobacteria bacterium]